MPSRHVMAVLSATELRSPALLPVRLSVEPTILPIPVLTCLSMTPAVGSRGQVHATQLHVRRQSTVIATMPITLVCPVCLQIRSTEDLIGVGVVLEPMVVATIIAQKQSQFAVLITIIVQAVCRLILQIRGLTGLGIVPVQVRL